MALPDQLTNGLPRFGGPLPVINPFNNLPQPSRQQQAGVGPLPVMPGTFPLAAANITTAPATPAPVAAPAVAPAVDQTPAETQRLAGVPVPAAPAPVAQPVVATDPYAWNKNWLGPQTPTLATTPAPGTTAPANSSGVHADFANTYGAAATRAAAQLGVDPSAILGQWGLETGYGKSIIPGTNNLGNIKDFSGGGVAATDNVTGSNDKYRAFATPNEFADHYASLISRKYPGAVGAGTDTAKFAGALAAGGYAQDPAYAAKVIASAGKFAGAPATAPSAVPAAGGSFDPVTGAPEGLVQVIKGLGTDEHGNPRGIDSYYTRPDGSDVHLYHGGNGELSEQSQAQRSALLPVLAGHQLQYQGAVDSAAIRNAGGLAEAQLHEQGLNTRQGNEIEATPRPVGTVPNPADPFAAPLTTYGIPVKNPDGTISLKNVGGEATRQANAVPKAGDGYNAPDGVYNSAHGKVTVQNKKIVKVE